MDGGVGFDEPELSWSTQDIEQKIGFSGGRYTDTNAFFTFLVGLILSTLFLVLEFVIGDSGTAAEWKEANSEMVTLEDGSQEEQVRRHPDSCCICRQVYQQRDWWILNGGWNNLTFFLGTCHFVCKGKEGKFSKENSCVKFNSSGS